MKIQRDAEAREVLLSEKLAASTERASTLATELAAGRALAARLRQDGEVVRAAAARARGAAKTGEEQHGALLAGLRARVLALEVEVARAKVYIQRCTYAYIDRKTDT